MFIFFFILLLILSIACIPMVIRYCINKKCFYFNFNTIKYNYLSEILAIFNFNEHELF